MCFFRWLYWKVWERVAIFRTLRLCRKHQKMRAKFDKVAKRW